MREKKEQIIPMGVNEHHRRTLYRIPEQLNWCINVCFRLRISNDTVTDTSGMCLIKFNRTDLLQEDIQHLHPQSRTEGESTETAHSLDGWERHRITPVCVLRDNVKWHETFSGNKVESLWNIERSQHYSIEIGRASEDRFLGRMERGTFEREYCYWKSASE